MFLSIIVGLVFIFAGLGTAVVVYFGGMFDAPGASIDWPAYAIALGAIALGVAITAFR